MMPRVRCSRASRGGVAVTAALLAACAAAPLDPTVVEVLGRDVAVELGPRSLTGTWTDDAGARMLLVHAGDAVVLLPLADGDRADMHFAEGYLVGEDLRVVGYRQGVSSETSVGGFDVIGVRAAKVDLGAETLTFSSGARWRRSESAPGRGRLTGVWSGPQGRVAVAHEGEWLVACAIDAPAREQWTTGYAWADPGGRLRMLRMSRGRVTRREVGGVDTASTRISWPGQRAWTLDAPLLGAPPAPPTPLSPAAKAELPNFVDGELRWTFDWSDVAGASAYRLEVVLGDSSRTYFAREDLSASRFEHVVVSEGFLRPTFGTWRVAAKVGPDWTDWSPRIRFRIAEL